MCVQACVCFVKLLLNNLHACTTEHGAQKFNQLPTATVLFLVFFWSKSFCIFRGLKIFRARGSRDNNNLLTNEHGNSCEQVKLKCFSLALPPSAHSAHTHSTSFLCAFNMWFACLFIYLCFKSAHAYSCVFTSLCVCVCVCES